MNFASRAARAAGEQSRDAIADWSPDLSRTHPVVTATPSIRVLIGGASAAATAGAALMAIEFTGRDYDEQHPRPSACIRVLIGGASAAATAGAALMAIEFTGRDYDEQHPRPSASIRVLM